MKKVILVTLILLTNEAVTKAQSINSLMMDRSMAVNGYAVNKANMNNQEDSAIKKENYLKKSRNYKIASISLVSGGFIIAGIGAIMIPKNYDPIWGSDAETENKADAASTVIAVGIAAMLSSIPFTILSSVNKRKANLMVTSLETAFGVPANVSRSITGITLSLPIGK